MVELDDEWDTFMIDSHNNSNNNNYNSHKEEVTFKHVEKLREVKDVPICDPITISTKTKIVYLNVSIDLFHRFWDLPMINYDEHKEGIIKKQIKFNFTSKEEVENNFKKYNLLDDRVVFIKGWFEHSLSNPNIKQLAIFGSSDPKKTPPLSRHAKLVYLGLSCSPCFERTCPLKHTNCLKNIKPSEIIKKII
jgi:hypothetical protein